MIKSLHVAVLLAGLGSATVASAAVEGAAPPLAPIRIADNSPHEPPQYEQGAAEPQGLARPPAGRADARGSHPIRMTVKQLLDKIVYLPDGSMLGSIGFVEDVDGKHFAVVATGTFPVLGTKPVAIPLSDMARTKGGFVARNITRQQVNDLRKFEPDKHKKIGRYMTVTVGG
ncbi:hypothetical protein [Jiella sp. M17.18]|uniref:hypothetical protein n=1 Tax=Jiella sp. M17.18 TaxID=3234247 RepID=UPI0034DFB5AC